MNDGGEREGVSRWGTDEVRDDELLLRRIHPSQVKEGRASSAAFKDPEMSVDRAELLDDPVVDALRDHPKHGVAQLLTKAARDLHQEVVSDPVDMFHRSHALVKGKKTDATAKKLAKASELLKAPEGE